MAGRRVKVIIKCKWCGEKYTLRGQLSKNKIETGFKRCICDNEQEFDMITEEL